jgi:hypothetical protein
MPVYQPASSPSPSSPSPSDGSSSTSSPALKNKPVKKRQKKVSVPGPAGIPGKGDGEGGLHVCVTCGRTDSPEWRKGPLGPKTLCNVSCFPRLVSAAEADSIGLWFEMGKEEQHGAESKGEEITGRAAEKGMSRVCICRVWYIILLSHVE